MASTALVVASIARQNGWVLKPDTPTHINRIDVRSETSTNVYTVSQTRLNGIWMCECLGYRSNRSKDSQGRRTCKHLREIVPVFEAALTGSTTRRIK